LYNKNYNCAKFDFAQFGKNFDIKRKKLGVI